MFRLGKSHHQANLEHQRKNCRIHYIKPFFMSASILGFSALDKMSRIHKALCTGSI